MPSATVFQCAKPSGVMYSTTARWPRVGRMYCPNVTTSTSCARSASSATWISSGLSPRPSMMEVLVTFAPASLALLSTFSDCAQLARRSLTEGVIRSTVSTLCAKTSSPQVATRSTSSMFPLKSGERTSTSTSGERAFISFTTFAMWLLPWSGRSSRSTEVMTMYPTPQLFIASAVFTGSKGSRGGGALLVFTAQNLHPRVQVSPITMMVAVAM
mmetsp:Transcript_38966/g.65509  ORF Transcript_38966/g.65509 Transcript_38966/m.65509 type:complete len:214 (-) Transcript_38966:476-1117(-)